ncbi:GCN5-related N-acetyltransferase [Croceitalea dokdonensis DOKDO 023]|uniref:GCN5-related N-acetyltransferase n=1 Tax=Croceitalea dokdonensis DOKDO 023 TaxID=1300341 RepID=A0A0N8H4E5_9FLAO|nr:GNAT family N-acetyltransferase [Croceitalea dokdonensis]KPM33148.1 GCN5-related N-acetyltransferase [Croceitalea dokdonensis DOKDO 023]
MCLQPTLENELVLLRPLRVSDFEALYKVAQDPQIWALHQNKDRGELNNFSSFFKDAITSNGALAIIDRTTRNIIGSSRFKVHPEDSTAVEIGWTFLSRAYWGGIYNASFKNLMISYAFRHFNYVVFNVDKHSYRSQKAVQKIGGELIKKKGSLGHLHTKKPTGLTFILRKTALC